MIRITAISDTHGIHYGIGKLPGGDILIHAGDFSMIGAQSQVYSFVDWFSKQEYKYKVFIAGNHDLCFESEQLQKKKEYYFYGHPDVYSQPLNTKPIWLESLLMRLPPNVFYLENQSTIIDGVHIWGSPVSPKFGWEWAFNKSRGYDINQIWQGIPNEVNIVVTHTPMHFYLDRVIHSCQYVGCSDLYYRLRDVKPLLHICGHIHEGYGYRETEWGHTINASIQNDLGDSSGYNHPITFDCDFSNNSIEFL
jgi:Icc-related predicted phosphoesterase